MKVYLIVNVDYIQTMTDRVERVYLEREIAQQFLEENNSKKWGDPMYSIKEMEVSDAPT